MDSTTLKSFLGTGWSFPPAFQLTTGAVQMVSEEDDIRQSLFLLFSTTPGERLMRPGYGCDLQMLVFERLNASTESQIADLIRMSILHYEPRITVEEVHVTLSDALQGRIDIAVFYTIRLTNSRDNIVYPFYFREGTNVHNM
ncbi:GPW/gp25 family protein [Neolewinella lacunae]|uniref:GPW/gp25 family protein n=1 Tax=Neolewinella lacunae TaxID=1517758 RepID=A0A923TAX7_9BACT|nr:GPW/gp25 family protein [Neolewinella lacunae]MBC6996658.1 GPW/gp25 family protein [Neolewinella lacunae]MDN3634777.1 GPW/gp25 family protein [Neolewinella lacunae]